MKTDAVLVSLFLLTSVLSLCGCSPNSDGGGGWKYIAAPDPLTGNMSYHAERDFTTDDGHQVEMSATCDITLFIPIHRVVFLVSFFDSKGKPLDIDVSAGLIKTGDDDYNFRSSTEAKQESYELGTLTHSNEVKFPIQQYDIALDGNESVTGKADLDQLKIEVPLADGRKPVIDFMMRDPELMKLTSRCFPPPPKATPLVPSQPRQEGPANIQPSEPQGSAGEQSSSDSTAGTADQLAPAETQANGNNEGGNSPAPDSPVPPQSPQ